MSDCAGTIFGYCVHDPEHYDVVEADAGSEVLSIEEKPRESKSNYTNSVAICVHAESD
ncbi:MAG TPA: sugar phosphate nucleotidyltransferase [Patescibacteria group bacterium]|nr:sugar phosphate nucleotidyltransferase [Patescibacteria group bacterium]